MGWAKGSLILSDIIDIIHENVKDDSSRKHIYEKLIDVFQDSDCDTIDECLGIDSVFDEIYNERYPNYYDDDY